MILIFTYVKIVFDFIYVCENLGITWYNKGNVISKLQIERKYVT